MTNKSMTLSSDEVGSPAGQQGDGTNLPVVKADEFSDAFAEPLDQTLDLDTWHPGADLVGLYERLRQEIGEAIKQEDRIQQEIRERIFPMLRTRDGAPPGAGVWEVKPEQLQDVHNKLLFNGGVAACDGTVVTHDTLPVTITQIGVCLVSYSGDQGSWMHRLFRRDLRASGSNQVEETLQMLDRRRERSAVDEPSSRDKLTSLARRGIMAYAERAILLERADAVWRMGHGSPTPYELMTGSGMLQLLKASLTLMRRLVLDHQKFVFVPSATTARDLLTIGNALPPLHYAVVDTNEANLARIASGHYRGEGWDKVNDELNKFVKECGSKIAVGVFRASVMAPAQVFYAHVDHVHTAALIAMADSVLQEHRGFPMLIDLADGLCTATFGPDVFAASTQLAYSESGQPYRYMAERKTRG
jgi:hypothetical protein